MRIAIFATNLYPTPPRREKMIYALLWMTYYLAEGLVKKGHRVFLFSSSDSKTSAQLISEDLPSLKKNKEWFKAYKKVNERWKEIIRASYESLLISRLYQMAQRGIFDIIQFHSKPRALYFASLLKVPIVFTIHDPFDHPVGTFALKSIYSLHGLKAKNVHFVSLSNAQRKPLLQLNYADTIYNGIDVRHFPYSGKKGDYFVFAGRIVPWKGLHLLVKAIQKTGQKLRIAGEIPGDLLDYWKTKIKPYLSNRITYQGMLTYDQMPAFYQRAKALLMPILWDEPFGLTMIEAQACGCPVIAFRRGSVPEVVKDKKTGFIVKDINGMIKALKQIDQIKRIDCRKHVERNFTMEKMVDKYEEVYYKILNEKT